jgi:hypothetical protein
MATQVSLNSGAVASAGALAIQTNGTTAAITISTSQNVGVGTASPTSKLQVAGSGFFSSRSVPTSGAGPEIYYDGTNAGWLAYNRTSSAYIPSVMDASSHTFNISGGEGLRITSAGNVGIGTSSPATNGATFGTLSLNGSNGGALHFMSANTTVMQLYNDANAFFINASSGKSTIFQTASTECMRIDSSGNLLVGSPTAFENSATRLQVYHPTVPAAEFSTGAGATTDAVGIWNRGTTGDNQFIGFYTEASATRRGSITYNRAGGLVAYNVTSDYRAKDISGPVINSGALIDSVPVYMGTIKGATQERPMFIAHETPAYAHTGEKDAVDKDGNPVYQQMDASSLIPVMWAEIQSLRKRLAALESA